MTYDDRRKDYSREHIYVVDLLMDYCELTYGDSPCEADLGVTGQRKCYNTRQTCQDPTNYDPEPHPYRHCSGASNLPPQLTARPDITAVSLSPTEIDIGGGLGRRASIEITFQDGPGSDIGIDKYLDQRIVGSADADGNGFVPLERGTYWGKFRARNPFYQNRFVEVYSGYITDGTFDLDNFQKRTYVIERIEGPDSNGRVRLVAKDPLKLTSIDRAQAPRPSLGQIAAAMTDTATSFEMSPGPEDDYPASGKIRINDEIMDYTRSGTTFTVTRGTDGTEAAEHDALDSVQLCLTYTADTVADVLFDLLTEFADVPASFIDKTAWDAEALEHFDYPVTTVISEPVGVADLLVELAESAPHQLWWDERTNLINLEAVKPPTGSELLLNDNDNFLADSVRITDAPDKRISQVWLYFGQADRTQALDDTSNYRQVYVRAALEREGDTQYRGRRIKRILSRWIVAASRDFAINSCALWGRRFGRIPRIAEFSISSRDADVWAGDIVTLRHRNIQDDTGAQEDLFFQIISVRERSSIFQYRALQVLFDPALPQDDQPNTFNLIVVSGVTDTDVNLRTIFGEAIGDVPPAAVVNFTIPNGVIVGSSSTASAALDTGNWPSDTQLNLTVASGAKIVGKQGPGGRGANFPDPAPSPLEDGQPGQNGGTAIRVRRAVSIDNQGIIGGGGGGGGGGGAAGSLVFLPGLITVETARGGSGGGSGAGRTASAGGAGGEGSRNNEALDGGVDGNPGQQGTAQTGGAGGASNTTTGPEGLVVETGEGGAGGDLGEPGEPGDDGYAESGNGGTNTSDGAAGGAPGAAIDGISLVTWINEGDVRGPEIN